MNIIKEKENRASKGRRIAVETAFLLNKKTAGSVCSLLYVGGIFDCKNESYFKYSGSKYMHSSAIFLMNLSLPTGNTTTAPLSARYLNTLNKLIEFI